MSKLWLNISYCSFDLCYNYYLSKHDCFAYGGNGLPFLSLFVLLSQDKISTLQIINKSLLDALYACIRSGSCLLTLVAKKSHSLLLCAGGKDRPNKIISQGEQERNEEQDLSLWWSENQEEQMAVMPSSIGKWAKTGAEDTIPSPPNSCQQMWCRAGWR